MTILSTRLRCVDHLCAAADALDANIQTQGLPLTTQDTVRTLRIAADSLYDAAERISLGSCGCSGEPIDAPDVAFAVCVALLKLGESGAISAQQIDLEAAYRAAASGAVADKERPEH